MEKKYYYKKRFENDIEGPALLSEIKAFKDNENIQITDFKSNDWTWVSDFQNNNKNKKNDNNF